MVPDPFGIHDGDRAPRADLQTVRLGAEDAAVAGEVELLEAALEIIPRFKAGIFVDALRFALIGAEEQVTLDSVGADFGEFVPRGSWCGVGHAARGRTPPGAAFGVPWASSSADSVLGPSASSRLLW